MQYLLLFGQMLIVTGFFRNTGRLAVLPIHRNFFHLPGIIFFWHLGRAVALTEHLAQIPHRIPHIKMQAEILVWYLTALDNTWYDWIGLGDGRSRGIFGWGYLSQVLGKCVKYLRLSQGFHNRNGCFQGFSAVSAMEVPLYYAQPSNRHHLFPNHKKQ